MPDQANVVPVAMQQQERHVHLIYRGEESDLATCIKEMIEGYFTTPCRAFTYEHDVAQGANWLANLHESISSADAAIALISADAMSAPAQQSWVPFETGAAWGKLWTEGSLLTVLHSGLSPENLHEALRPLRALDAHKAGFASTLMNRLGTILKLTPRPEPHVPISDDRVREALKKVAETRKSYDLFIAAPRNSFPALKRGHSALMTGLDDIVGSLSGENGFSRVYPGSFDVLPDVGIPDSFVALRRSERFMMIFPEKLASGALAEAGMAIALRIPSVYWIKREADLPKNLLYAAKNFRNVKFITYSDAAEIVKTIKEKGGALFEPRVIDIGE